MNEADAYQPNAMPMNMLINCYELPLIAIARLSYMQYFFCGMKERDFC